ncbi:MAG: hypothetical protein AB7F96_03385 [Beijerinckiaceae bacterium]
MRAVLFYLVLSVPATAQILPNDRKLHDQLIPQSFQLEASAIAGTQFDHGSHRTMISYTITNKTGLNLYMGIAMNTIAIGICADTFSVHGGLQLLPHRGVFAYGVDIQAGPPRAAFVSAGGKIGGTIIMRNCYAPNPGSATAPVSMSLMVGNSESPRQMTQVSVSAQAAVRLMEYQQR